MLKKPLRAQHLSKPEVKTHRTVSAISSWLSRSVGSRAIRVMPDYHVAMGTTQGVKRQENQDRVLMASNVGTDPWENFELFAVCDGLGGMRAGGQCAAMALAHVVIDLVRTRRSKDRRARLERALTSASNAVFEVFKEQGGTTIAAILFDAEGGTAIAVGDTRIYSLESDAELIQITTDDTIGARVAQFQGKDAQTVQRGPFADNLAQFVGQAVSPVPQVYEIGVTSKDSGRDLESKRRALFITTDGIHRIPKKVMADLIQATPVMRETVARLVALSEWLGGHDNASILSIEQSRETPGSKSLEVGPFLLLNDPFGELRLSVGHAEEFSETTNVLGNVALEEPDRSAIGTAADGQQQNGDIGSKIHVSNVQSVDPETHFVRSEDEVRDDEAIGKRVGSGADAALTTLKTAKRQSKSSKPRKVKKKKKKGKDESPQPELNIRISQEPD